MQTIITGRHLEVTDAMRAYVEKKISKLNKHHDRLSEMQVIVAAEGLDHKIEIIVKADNHQRFVANHAGPDAYACLDVAMDKIERQLMRYKEKTHNHKKRAGTAETAADMIESQITPEESQ